jgi:G3E family GTPase
MVKVDIFSGFLGAGKTTLIKKLIAQAYQGEKLVLIENEFGEIGIDGGFMKDAGVEINELNSGCICCSLTGDFRAALHQVIEQFHPDRILIEPSGVGKLSDVISAVLSVEEDIRLNGLTTIADAGKCRMYIKNFGEFFNNQIEYAACVILSRTQNLSQEKLDAAVALLREHNPAARIITTPWDILTGEQILDAIERRDALSDELAALLESAKQAHEEDECDDPDCACHHHHGDAHEHHHDEDGHEHHHHDEEDECDDPDCACHHHHGDAHEHHHNEDGHEHHHHDEEDECDDPDCACHHHHGDGHGHHHHHGHDADEIFASWGEETAHKFSKQKLASILEALNDTQRFGMVVRAKGIVDGGADGWFHFDFTPGESEIRTGGAEVTGRVCVIGAQLNIQAVRELFLGA